MLANSEAVKLYSRSNKENGLPVIQELSARGVHFVACNNALREFGITQEQLESFVYVVPVGVVELSEKQME